VQRWLKFVKYLPSFGIEPVVYTVENPSYAIIDNTLQREVPKNIIILKQPIKEPNRFFSLFGSSKKKVSAGFLDPKPSLLGKMAQYIRANFFIPDARKFWIKPSVKYLLDYLSKEKIDLIITTGPPHSLHLIGLQLTKKTDIKWIADFRDPWTDIDYFHLLPLTEKAKQKHHDLEKEVVSTADQVIVVGKTMKNKFLQFNENIEVITNGYDDILQDTAEPLDSQFTFVHVGMMNADRNPLLFWEVLSELVNDNDSFANDLKIKLIGKLDDQVLRSIEDHKLAPFVEIIAYLPHEEVKHFQKCAQVLLLAVNKVPSAKGIITGKIFEYMQAKRPILAIGPTDGDLAEIIEQTKTGKVIDFEDKVKLKNTIIEMYNGYKNKTLKVDSRNIEQFHRKNLTHQLAQIIKNIDS
jgi:glycosyltransferase involved in cell wall biosynthesis